MARHPAGEYGETEAAQRENVQKLMAERAIEMAFLFETVHKIPDPKLRERVLKLAGRPCFL